MVKEKETDSMEQIAAIMMHELKTPLALISANVDYLELCDEDKRFLKNYAVVKHEVEKANRILKEFIDILSGSAKCPECVGVCEIITEIAGSYTATYGNDILFSFDFEDDKELGESTIDKMAFTIVFGNTIKNAVEAIKAAGRGESGRINIFSKSDREYIIFQVVDNGTGLDKKTAALLKRGEQYSTKENGSGIGISICKKIMEELGGSYSISNRSGVGCIVDIRVPNAEGNFFEKKFPKPFKKL